MDCIIDVVWRVQGSENKDEQKHGNTRPWGQEISRPELLTSKDLVFWDMHSLD